MLSRPGAGPLPPSRQLIEFRAVQFASAGARGRSTLDCVSFSVRAGQMLATIKIIPYAVPADALEAVLAAVRNGVPAMSVHAWRGTAMGLVMTRTPDTRESVLAKMRQSVLKRLEPLRGALAGEQVVAHDEQSVAGALRSQLSGNGKPDVLLVCLPALGREA